MPVAERECAEERAWSLGCRDPRAHPDKSASAELRPNQTDQDSLPPYDVLDDILFCLVENEMPLRDVIARGHDAATVQKVEKLLYLAEYKRRQAAAPGVKIFGAQFRARPAVSDYQPLPGHRSTCGAGQRRADRRAACRRR